MKAVVWHGRRDVRTETVPDPTIDRSDRCDRADHVTGLCGSDLHLYEVMAPFMTSGDILGHEPMGIVEAVGPAVTDIASGDRVVVPFNIACGHCLMCERGLQSQCETTQVREHGMWRSAVRLHQAVRPGPRRTGRVLAGSPRRLRTDQGARRPAGRPVPVPVRRAADRLAGRAVRRAAHLWWPSSCWASARSARCRRGSPTSRRGTRDRHRPGSRASRASARSRGIDVLDLERVRFGRRPDRRRSGAHRRTWARRRDRRSRHGGPRITGRQGGPPDDGPAAERGCRPADDASRHRPARRPSSRDRPGRSRWNDLACSVSTAA